ncbi:YraN family protein [Cohnella nanjingensis]|uniref:UPF0102 protein H7C19_28250 n=1 Tax=Cohnella nanjingensis TaxID=1387779 RepID=A0A7X0RVS2_9BACL|nr:YraN family protein [Cohnella nanjingensis]MBB6674579.1 YraN family protein [Cohnella nanjingensis]
MTSAGEGRTDGRRARGIAAESAAADHLAGLGYRIVARNWRCKSGELDLVAQDGETLVFAEVGSRRGSAHYGTAVEAVTPRKCAQVRSTAQVYLHQTRQDRVKVRFDVVAVTFDARDQVAELRHLQGAF